MLDVLSTNHYIIIFSSIIIISYFFNSYSKKTGVPSVLMLIVLGMVFGVYMDFQDRFSFILEILGTVGLILIVLEGALGLKLLKSNVLIIFKSFAVSAVTLGGSSYIGALVLNSFFQLDIGVSLLITVPLSILSSSILLPSIDSVEENKREFLIYESTFSDIIGIIFFYTVLRLTMSINVFVPEYGLIISNLFGTTLFSVIISFLLIYVFQKLTGQAKLFLLISVLMILYAFAEMFNFSSLIIILMFGLILNNYKLFFKGILLRLIENEEKVESIIDDFKVVTLESAFVVRTFFFIIFGWSIKITDLFDLKSLLIGGTIVLIIFSVRMVTLLIFSKTTNVKNITPELFLAPRGLLTILLFYSIPRNLLPTNINFEGVFLYVIIICCLIMAWSLIYERKKRELKENEDFEILNVEDVDVNEKDLHK